MPFGEGTWVLIWPSAMDLARGGVISSTIPDPYTPKAPGTTYDDETCEYGLHDQRSISIGP